MRISKLGFHFPAVFRFAFENGDIVNSKDHFVAFKNLLSVSRIEYSLKYIYFSFGAPKGLSRSIKNGKNILRNLSR